jgi:hypothetical protein
MKGEPLSFENGAVKDDAGNVVVPGWQAWYKPLGNGSAAVFVANHGDAATNITIDFNEV